MSYPDMFPSGPVPAAPPLRELILASLANSYLTALAEADDTLTRWYGLAFSQVAIGHWADLAAAATAGAN